MPRPDRVRESLPRRSDGLVNAPDPPPVRAESPAAAFLRVLRLVERYPLGDLVMHQARRVETIVRHARANVPFYAERLNAVFAADDVLDLSRWGSVPVLTAADVRANAEALRARSVPDLAGDAVGDQTSGTGGDALHFVRSRAAVSADAANSLRIFLDHEFDADGRFADIRIDVARAAQYPDGQIRPGWSYGRGSGDFALLDISTPQADQVEWLVRMQPAILFTWAMNARTIALMLEAAGARLPLTSLATSAEICTPGVRTDCRRVFGLDPVDILGAREIGIIAWQCHAGPHYHFTAESAFTEVLDDNGAPSRPGETGRLVATGFYNFHMPFVRYATGDYVTLANGPCPCGRTLPSITAIPGRARNRLRLPDGSRVFPALPEEALDRLIGPVAWRLVQETPGSIKVVVEQDTMPRAEAALAAVRDAVAEAFGDGYRVELATPLPTPPGAWRKKRELFRSLVS